MVAIEPEKRSKSSPRTYPPSAGLYKEERELLLISLSTGRAHRMPHLSNRADLTSLKLEDVLPDLVNAPMLVSAEDDLLVRVTMSSVAGRIQHHINLAKPAQVLEMLQGMAVNADHIMEVKTAEELADEQEEAKSHWRAAVAAGKTLASFEEFAARMV